VSVMRGVKRSNTRDTNFLHGKDWTLGGSGWAGRFALCILAQATRTRTRVTKSQERGVPGMTAPRQRPDSDAVPRRPEDRDSLGEGRQAHVDSHARRPPPLPRVRGPVAARWQHKRDDRRVVGFVDQPLQERPGHSAGAFSVISGAGPAMINSPSELRQRRPTGRCVYPTTNCVVHSILSPRRPSRRTRKPP
jgi:hypothetical protein